MNIEEYWQGVIHVGGVFWRRPCQFFLVILTSYLPVLLRSFVRGKDDSWRVQPRLALAQPLAGWFSLA